MVKLRRVRDNALRLALAAVMGAAGVVGVSGCGKPAPPPPGATNDTTTPNIDLGAETEPKDSTPAPETSPPGGGTPEGEKGEPK